MAANDIKERLRMCSPYSDDGTMNNRTANALLTEAASEIARLEQALAAANGEAESTRYLLAEEKRRAAELERKLRVAVEACRKANTCASLPDIMREMCRKATNAAVLEVGS